MADSDAAGTTQPPLFSNEEDQSVDVLGVLSLVFFYAIVLAVGIWASWKQKRSISEDGREVDQEEVMLGGRNIGLVVGVMTMGATWVGGGFINGSAEAAYKYGLVWVQASFGFGLSLFISGTFFAKKMRDAHYVTMIDPFTQKYGKWGALQALPSAVSEIFWSASILGALGTTLRVILKINTELAIILSAVIAVLYTLMGGLVSVAYTDVFQLSFIAIGLILSLPFAATNPAVSSLSFDVTDWAGSIPNHLIWEWFDFAMLLLFGGIPWQVYFQRVLSSKTSKRAVLLSYGGAVIAISMAIPATIFGGVAKATDWSQTGFKRTPTDDEAALVLPLCLQYLTPRWVSFFGLGAISAAVMSSTDSSMLSASSMLSRNVYRSVFRPQASEKETLFALWVLIICNACVATILAITYQSIYNLFVLCGDFVFVIVFPQLVLVLYMEKSNTYGSVFSFFLGLLLRILCGDTLLKIPPTISFGSIPSDTPGEAPGPVPFRTIVMLISLLTHMLLSWLTDYLFMNKIVKLEFDFFQCFKTNQSTGMVHARSSRYLISEDISLNDMTAQTNQGTRGPSYTNNGYN